jgi:hypothetical protein
VKGIPDAATAAEVKAMIDAFLQNPQIKFKGAPGTRPVGGPLTLEFVGVSQGLADMGEVRRQGKQSAESEIIRSTGSMGNTANTGTIAGRAEQVGERIAGSIIGGILRKQSDKVLGHPEGDMAITFKVQTGRARGEVSTHTTTVRYAINERTGKISLGHVREGARELPGSGPTAEKYTSGSQELNSAAIKKAVEAAIADARADGPIKSYLALELMMYATAPAPSEQRTELRPTVSENSSMQATPRAERSPDGMVPMHGARQPEVQRVPEAEAPKAAEKPAPRILPVNRRNNQ